MSGGLRGPLTACALAAVSLARMGQFGLTELACNEFARIFYVPFGRMRGLEGPPGRPRA